MRKIFLFLIALLLSACGASMQAQRLSISEGDKKAMSVTDDWLITDTNQAVESLIGKLTTHGRYKRYLREHNNKIPKIFVAEIQNMTSEDDFPIEGFNNKLLDDLFNTGDFDLVSVKDRDKILKEIKYQNSGMVKQSDIKSIGKASGADLIISGEIVMEAKKFQGKTLKEYSVSIRLVDIESGEEVARAIFETTKYSQKKKFAW